jgi:hypothetical protein
MYRPERSFRHLLPLAGVAMDRLGRSHTASFPKHPCDMVWRPLLFDGRIVYPSPPEWLADPPNLQKILMVALCVGLAKAVHSCAGVRFETTQCDGIFSQHLTLTSRPGTPRIAFPEIDRGQLPGKGQLLSCCPCSKYFKRVSRPAGSS